MSDQTSPVEGVDYITITPSREARQALLVSFLAGELDSVLYFRRRYRNAKTIQKLAGELEGLAASLIQAAKTTTALLATFTEDKAENATIARALDGVAAALDGKDLTALLTLSPDDN